MILLVLAGLVAWQILPAPGTPQPGDAIGSAAASLVAAAEPFAPAPFAPAPFAPAPFAPAPFAPADPATDRERLLIAAYNLRGVPYRFGAKGPDYLDCSGFTKVAYAKIGVRIPDGSYNQAAGEKPLVDPAVLVPGDLVFYRWAGQNGVSHVTMYAGDGWLIGTGTPGQPGEVAVYPLAADLVADGRVLTYRHIRLPDER